MAALTKADLAEHLFTTIGLNKREAKDLIEVFFEEIRSNLESGHPVKIANFGRFDLRDKGERPGRNPKTGIAVPVTRRRVVTFRASQHLKDVIKNYSAHAKQ